MHVKTNMISNRDSSVFFFTFFIDFQVKNIVDFVKTNVFPEETHVFWSSEFFGGNAFLNSQAFEKIRFGIQKTVQNQGQNTSTSIQIFMSNIISFYLRKMWSGGNFTSDF